MLIIAATIPLVSEAVTAARPESTIRVRDESSSPPGGWRCRVEETGAVFSNPAFSQLLSIVAAHLGGKNLDPATASDRIHETTAKALVGAKRADLVTRVTPVTRTAEQYASGAIAAMMGWWSESPIKSMLAGKFGRGEPVFVDQAEANRRAAICAECETGNVMPTGKGWLQSWTDGKMLDSVMGRKTDHHEKLGVCKVCTCELRAAVWWPADILRASAVTKKQRDATRYPEPCWKRAIYSQP